MGDAKVWINKGNRDWTLDELVAAFERLEVSHDAWRVRAEKAVRERDEARDDAKAKAGEVAHLQSLLAQVRGERDEAKAKIAELETAIATCGNCEYHRVEMERARERSVEANARLKKAERERDEAKEEVQQWRLGRARACACVSCEGPLTCGRCTARDGSANAAEDRKSSRAFDCLKSASVDDDHEARIKALEAKLDGIAPAAFGPRYAGHCSECGIDPAVAHLAGCSKAVKVPETIGVTRLMYCPVCQAWWSSNSIHACQAGKPKHDPR